eukprot:203433_1
MYETIANCFAFDFNSLQSTSNYDLATQQSWICCNCSNYNFNYYIAGKVNSDLKLCSLCGITQRDSIIMKLRKHDTYAMVNDKENSKAKKLDENTDVKDDGKEDDISSMIETVIKTNSLKLHCLDRNDNAPCPSILRLAKQLILYKRWIDKIDDVSVDKTTQVDIYKFVSNDEFKQIFNKSVEFITATTSPKMFAVPMVDIMNKEVFLKCSRKTFVSEIEKQTNKAIKKAQAASLYKCILRLVQKRAQRNQYGNFISSKMQSQIVDDYHHILQSHIKSGNKTIVEHCFRFFGKVVHYEDVPSKVEKCVEESKLAEDCKSISRIKQRQQILHLANDIDPHNKTNTSIEEDNNIWSAQQYYIQKELDIIHAYLVHSNWELFFNRYSKKSDKKDTQKQNFISDILQESTAENYGFGIDHQHQYLKPKYICMRDELIFNRMCRLSITQFRHSIIKALNKHRVVLNSIMKEINKHNIPLADIYKQILVCKYYRKEFNIIRNEPIGIRHILALIIYSDMTGFCTMFRKTYRKIKHDERDEEVIERHQQVYFYSRALWESVEFFGQQMNSSLQVYHGLKRVMCFQKFCAYFQQPLSTTTTKISAQNFSEGVGIILSLKSGARAKNKKPKFLPLSSLSDFPQEEELLFHGKDVILRVHNIIEAKNLQGHTDELLMLNEFQKIVSNEPINLQQHNPNVITGLKEFIINQIDNGKPQFFECKTITEYGQKLFGYFCNHQNTTSIAINNYLLLPTTLRHALLYVKTLHLDSMLQEISENKLWSKDITTMQTFLQDQQYDTDALKYDLENFVENQSNIVSCVDNSAQLLSAIMQYIEETHVTNSEKHLSLIPITKLFLNLKEIKLSNLIMEEMLTNKQSYINMVLELLDYIHHNTQFANNWMKITIQTEPQQDRRDNPILKNLVNQKSKDFDQYSWSIEYVFDDMISLTHSLVFVNKNKNIYIKNSKSVTETKTNSLLTANKFITNKWTVKLDYFVQVTSISADVIHVKLNVNKIENKKKRRFRLKEIQDNNSETVINKAIIIDEKTNSTEVVIPIDAAHCKSYNFALFDSKDTDRSLPNSNQLLFDILQNKNEYPPHNNEYKPNPIDSMTVLRIKDNETKSVHVIWSIPCQSFGDIKYKIVTNNILDTEIDEKEIFEQQTDIIQILTKQIETKNDEKLNKNKDKIIEYFKVNAIDYSKWVNLSRKHFCQ